MINVCHAQTCHTQLVHGVHLKLHYVRIFYALLCSNLCPFHSNQILRMQAKSIEECLPTLFYILRGSVSRLFKYALFNFYRFGGSRRNVFWALPVAPHGATSVSGRPSTCSRRQHLKWNLQTSQEDSASNVSGSMTGLVA